NYDKDLNMAVVSNHGSMNYSLFSYAFKQYTGHNFVSYLKELRVNEAKRLLAETDMRVIEISRRVGYENEKHFMKTFKSQCGVSPTEYRRNMSLSSEKSVL
ncbi:MAG: AraC family transcriptional regulator, partial [Lachnospiraceae bacterium]|nr:AraC family transcriptional regulator [Lachnospiraceae bacterium]